MKSAKYLLQRQIGSEVEIVDVLPDTIFFRFSEMVKRKLPVEPTLTIKTEQQYILSDHIMISPDSVIANGPAKVIDTMPAVYTESISIENLADTLERDINLRPCKYVTFEPLSVHIVIPVERFTEVTIDIPIRVKNISGEYFLKTFPTSVKVTCHVALSKYSMVKPDMFKAEVDYLSVHSSIDNKLKVTLADYPDFIELIDYKPKNVDYLIEK
jgi:hypothetical protein